MRLVCVLIATGWAFAQSSDYQGVATTKQLMAGVQKPAMDELAGMAKAGGPKTDKDWELAQRDAAVLAESAQLLLMGSRPLDQDLWIKSSHRLQESATAAAKAAEVKDLATWKTSVGSMGGACRSCHNVHKKPKQQQ